MNGQEGRLGMWAQNFRVKKHHGGSKQASEKGLGNLGHMCPGGRTAGRLGL